MNYYSNPKTYKQIWCLIQAARDRGLDLTYTETTITGLDKAGNLCQWAKRPQFYLISKSGEEIFFCDMNTKKISLDIKMMRESKFDWAKKY